MRVAIRLVAIVTGIFVAQFGIAQAPAGSTGQCKDGTYTTSANKSGACKGHQGIKEWYAANSSAPAASAAGGSATSAPDKTAKGSTANKTQAPGGGPGMVWLNTDSNIYHCPGSQFYGKTKQGAYMSEADAKAKGAHPDHNRPCTK